MSDFKTCTKNQFGNIVTPKCRIGFPQLLVAKTPPGSDKAKYSVTLLIPDDADISLLKKEAYDVAVEKFSKDTVDKLTKSGRFKWPFLKAADCEGTKGKHFPDEVDDWTVLRVSSVQRPQIVDARGHVVDEEAEIYSGRWARASVRPFAYDTNGNRGVSFGLQNMQLLDHADPFAGGRVQATSEFAPVETGAGGLLEDDEIPF